MLKNVKKPDGSEISFEYDALGRRTTKTYQEKVTRFVWDSNVLLHEWNYDQKKSPRFSLDNQGEFVYTSTKSTENLITWVYEDGSFVPSAKIIGGEKYSIISDYIGRPIQAYDDNGNKVWETDYDIYGRLRNLQGEKQFVAFRQLGQYEDEELDGLYYNRFRYYDCNIGGYISQDPIGLEGNNPNFYAYVYDSNLQYDPFGLECPTIWDSVTGKSYNTASEMPVIKPGTKAWKSAVESIKSPGKSKNVRVGSKAEATQLMNEARPGLTEQPTYTEIPYKDGYEYHPNESHTENAPHNNLEHIKWKEWSSGKSSGGNGHIFY
ncbi:RHS repeat-associated core domain-containing protein [Chryseobacterium sp. KC 927]|uniref:RHS repeat-associated core domain-containing protein n=2 Tax=Chryseobacterium luquanense TaxID=2983766 RepID=A0ABT3Y827_9FLAO|nr:RHS repeat-associated core domain-containing protein [Chryseobacterium luquanense]